MLPEHPIAPPEYHVEVPLPVIRLADQIGALLKDRIPGEPSWVVKLERNGRHAATVSRDLDGLRIEFIADEKDE